MRKSHAVVGAASVLLLSFLIHPAPAQQPPDAKPHPAPAQPTAPAVPATTDKAPKPAEPAAVTPLAHVETKGHGPIPMILIPGLACDWTVYQAFMDRNADRYTMYAVTLPGFGGSDAPPLPERTPVTTSLWLDNAVAAVSTLVSERKLDKPVVVGHSLGGHLAFRLAIEHPDQFRAAVALDGAPAFPLGTSAVSKEKRAAQVKSMSARMLAMTDEQWQSQTRMTARMMVKDADRAKAIGDITAGVPAHAAVRYMLELMASDASDGLPDLKIPVLMLPAISDALQTPEQAESVRNTWKEMFTDAPKVKVVFFDKTRHFITEDAPEKLDQTVAEFLKEQGSPTKPPAKSSEHGN
jgi:pimeloyl-ACP methyl ester carboxylesterase